MPSIVKAPPTPKESAMGLKVSNPFRLDVFNTPYCCGVICIANFYAYLMRYNDMGNASCYFCKEGEIGESDVRQLPDNYGQMLMYPMDRNQAKPLTAFKVFAKTQLKFDMAALLESPGIRSHAFAVAYLNSKEHACLKATMKEMGFKLAVGGLKSKKTESFIYQWVYDFHPGLGVKNALPLD